MARICFNIQKFKVFFARECAQKFSRQVVAHASDKSAGAAYGLDAARYVKGRAARAAGIYDGAVLRGAADEIG